jgi:hypothetical protein
MSTSAVDVEFIGRCEAGTRLKRRATREEIAYISGPSLAADSCPNTVYFNI